LLSLLALHLRLLALSLLTSPLTPPLTPRIAALHRAAPSSPAGPIGRPLRRRARPAPTARGLEGTPQAQEHERSEHAGGTAGRPAHDDAGYTTESIIVTALLAAAAITIIAILVAKLVDKAHSITL